MLALNVIAQKTANDNGQRAIEFFEQQDEKNETVLLLGTLLGR